MIGAGEPGAAAEGPGESPESPLLQALAGGEISLGEFAEEVRRRGTPLIEATDGGAPDEALVTFLHLAEEPVEEVGLWDPVSWLPPERMRLTRLPASPVWYLSRRTRTDLRFSYSLLVDGAPVGDPLNRHPRHTDPRLQQPVAVLPGADPLPWLPDPGTEPTGALHAHSLGSELLGNERPVWVSTPPGWSPTGGPYPFVVIFDGLERHTAPLVRDQLLAAGEIPPVVVILVDEIGRRDEELTANADFSRMLATELVPWARSAYALSAEPRDAVVSGSSFGGLCAGWTALQHPEVFGNALLQSASCWYHPNLTLGRADRSHAPVVVGEPAAVPTLVKAFAAAKPVDIRIYQECGALENGPPPARIWQVFGNRWLHDILELKGYATTYREFAGGHDTAWWRGTWADGLVWLLRG